MAEPGVALDELLRGRLFLGDFNAAQPNAVLAAWSNVLAEKRGYRVALDSALRSWIEANWGLAWGADESLVELANTWEHALRAIARIQFASDTSRVLIQRQGEASLFLGSLSRDRSLDPLGTYYLAVAVHQSNDELRQLWLQLCKLGPDTPYYHGGIGLLGLTLMPNETGSLPREVPAAMMQLAVALENQISAGFLKLREGREEFLAQCRLALEGLPFTTAWRKQIDQLLAEDPSLVLGEHARAWLSTLFPKLDARPRAVSLARSGEFKNRAETLAERLRSQANAGDVDAARKLLADQLRFLLDTGNSSFYVKSLCFFADSIRTTDPELSLKWTEEAKRWEPWNVVTLTSNVESIRAVGATGRAAFVAWRALDRFVHNSYAWTQVALVLREAGCPEEEFAVLDEAKFWFPNNHFVAQMRNKVGIAAEQSTGAVAFRDFILETPDLDPGQRKDLLLRSARFFRRRATRNIGGAWPTHDNLIKALEELGSPDPRQMVENFLAKVDREPDSQVADAPDVNLLTGAPSFYAIARAERRRLRGTTYDDILGRRVEQVWTRLVKAHPTLRPVGLLGNLRSLASMSDSQAWIDATQDSLQSFNQWKSSVREADEFYLWWIESVVANGNLLGSDGDGLTVELGDDREENQTVLDSLEEFCLVRSQG
jgi:hypothetical protein